MINQQNLLEGNIIQEYKNTLVSGRLDELVLNVVFCHLHLAKKGKKPYGVRI